MQTARAGNVMFAVAWLGTQHFVVTVAVRQFWHGSAICG